MIHSADTEMKVLILLLKVGPAQRIFIRWMNLLLQAPPPGSTHPGEQLRCWIFQAFSHFSMRNTH